MLPRATSRGCPKVPPGSSHLLRLVELPFPSVIPLPPGAEATIDIHLADNGHLKKAFDDLEAPFAAFLDSASPPVDWVIHDFPPHWMPRLAVPRHLPCAFFSVFHPAAVAFWGKPLKGLRANADGSGWWLNLKNLTVPPPWITEVSPTMAFYTHEAMGFGPFLNADVSGVSAFYRLISTFDAVQLVIVRSCPDVDGDWIRLLHELLGKPSVPIGLLSPAVEKVAASPQGEIFEWLDRQASASVLYVALGSEAVISVELFHELAHGLDLPGFPFLWALRRPARLPPEAELIPEGFEAKAAGKGMVVKGWVPQPEVLAHPAVGSFLTHCGWSSIIEGLIHGLPLVLLPLFVDQGLNSRLATGKGVFTGEGVAETVRFVAADAAGEPVGEAARGAAAVFSDYALQKSYVDGLAQCLVENKDKLRP
ncbi:unnamed protein product [Spirodela intermedia]|uniref:Uncharacterized protein n=1 Tax=Spirodela intermedia TaxID=51605 RepID=A0A7I8K8R2_SPIIN|nr:unnamed protein product [Spirodela intermedia]